MTEAEMTRRMTELESRDAYNQRAVEEGNVQIYDLSQRVARLETLVAKLVHKVKDLAEEKEPGLPVGERPPHY